MKLRRLPLSKLRSAPYNPRVALQPGDRGFEKLRRSLTEFDLVQPLVWNQRTGHVVGGHQRLEVLRDEGRTQVDCVVVDLPLEREKALNITLNNDEVASDWDPEKLLDVVEELQELPEFDATLTGFDEQQLNDLILSPSQMQLAEWRLDDDETLDKVRAVLEIPPDRWDDVRPTLDGLLAQEPSLTLHVQLPTATDR